MVRPLEITVWSGQTVPCWMVHFLSVSEYKFGGGALKIPAASTARVTLDSSVGIGGEESGYFSLSVWFKNLHDRSSFRSLATGEEYNVFVLVSPNSDNLGVHQSNNGSFRDSGYDLNVSSTLDWTNLVATFDGSTRSCI